MSLRCAFRVLNMGISITQWRIAVSVHTFRKAPLLRIKLVFGSYSFCPVFLFVLYFAFQMFVGICTSILITFKKSLKNVTIYFNHVGFCYLLFHGTYLLILCDGIELNAGPKDAKYLSLCHWNLNSIAAHDFAKVSALKAFNTTKNFDFICLSESYLDSTISSDDKNLCLDGYKLIRADHPKNIKQGGVCIYYRETLPVKIIQLSYLPECLVCEINYDNKKIFIITLDRSPSQSTDEFDEFLRILERIVDNINQYNTYFTLITGDFNARCNRWWENDSNNTEGVSIDNLTSSYGLKQLIAEPTYIFPTSSSCIDLLFTNQYNMVVNSGVFPSTH